MKIKTKALPYERVLALPLPERKKPRRPALPLRALVRALAAGDLKDAQFTYTMERMEGFPIASSVPPTALWARRG